MKQNRSSNIFILNMFTCFLCLCLILNLNSEKCINLKILCNFFIFVSMQYTHQVFRNNLFLIMYLVCRLYNTSRQKRGISKSTTLTTIATQISSYLSHHYLAITLPQPPPPIPQVPLSPSCIILPCYHSAFIFIFCQFFF